MAYSAKLNILTQICSTVEEWRDFLNTYCSDCKSTKGSQFELVKSLKAVSEAVIDMLEQREQAKQRRKDRLLKVALKAQALEMVPKKRSSRLEQKVIRLKKHTNCL